jgi:chorismate synthase
MAVPSVAHVKGFHFRRLEKPEEFRSAEELQREVWGNDESVPVSGPRLREMQDHGGLVLGAYVDIYLAGVVGSSLGWDGKELYQFVGMAAVRPEYRQHRVGVRLGAYLREQTLQLGLPTARWLIDPLDSRAAHVSLRALGAVPERYLTHYFGTLATPSDRGLETDRLLVRWPLGDAAVEARLAAPPAPTPTSRAPATPIEGYPLLLTEVADSGLRYPTEVREPDGPRATIEIPFDLDAIHQHESARLRPWRHAVRDAFRAALDSGYTVRDFAVQTVEHERRSFYCLEATTRTAEPGSAASPHGPK